MGPAPPIAAVDLGGLGHVLLRSLSGLENASIAASVDVSPAARERFEREFGAPSYTDVE